jgi:hypothetical protein
MLLLLQQTVLVLLGALKVVHVALVIPRRLIDLHVANTTFCNGEHLLKLWKLMKLKTSTAYLI